MTRIRVLIVDDSRLMREMFSGLLAADPEIEVVGAAEDPFEAREMIKRLNPDVITLDIEMPKMDGLTFLERIMTLRPMPVVMVSTLTQKGADATVRALELGAVEVMGKPTATDAALIAGMREELIAKVKTAARAKVGALRRLTPAAPAALSFGGHSHYDIIAIGASTGGVEALRDLLVALPANTPPIVITQHMPEKFTASFAARLDGLCAMRVHEARPHQPIEAGKVYIAPGGMHLEIKRSPRGYQCHVYQGCLISGHKPSVDALFHSVAVEAGDRAIGVILTGMGKDGAQGLLAMRRKGSPTLGQDESSCVVYGMPKAAKLLDAVGEELPLPRIAGRLLELCTA